MTVDNNNNDIIVSENHNTIIITSKLVGVTECGKWNICYNEETGKKTYKPTDPDYYNKQYHKNKKEITCEVCGCVIMKKITQHKKTMKCRLTHFIQQEQLKLKEEV